MGRQPFVANRAKKNKKKEPVDEEYDYMSESVILKVKEEVSEKEKLAVKKKKEKNESQPRSHSTIREEALATPLPSSNIGFKLLQQMGYK